MRTCRSSRSCTCRNRGHMCRGSSIDSDRRRRQAFRTWRLSGPHSIRIAGSGGKRPSSCARWAGHTCGREDVKTRMRTQGKARQGKARQGKAGQGKARQGKARQGKARQGKALLTYALTHLRLLNYALTHLLTYTRTHARTHALTRRDGGLRGELLVCAGRLPRSAPASTDPPPMDDA